MKALSMTKHKTMLVCLSVLLAGAAAAWANDPDVRTWTNYFKQTVEGGASFQVLTNDAWRDGGATNAFKTLGVKGYRLKSSSVAQVQARKNITVRTLEYDAGERDPSHQFSVSIVEGRNGRDEAMNGLAYLMSSSSNMGGIRFKRFMEGPGDVCLVSKGADPFTNAAGLGVLFFCRDNIAVMVVPYSPQSDILPFGRLFDSSLMSLPARNEMAQSKK